MIPREENLGTVLLHLIILFS